MARSSMRLILAGLCAISALLLSTSSVSHAHDFDDDVEDMPETLEELDAMMFENFPPEAVEDYVSRPNFDEPVLVSEGTTKSTKYFMWFLEHEQLFEARLLMSKEKFEYNKVYMEALYYSHVGQVNRALQALNRSIEADAAPFTMFQAGPREELAPLYQTQTFNDLAAEHGRLILHGPLMGDMTHNSVKVWFRTATEGVEISLVLRNKKGKELDTSVPCVSSADRDYTTICSLTGLKPNRRYKYDVVVDGVLDAELSGVPFRTHPHPRASKTKFNVVMAGCSNIKPENEDAFVSVLKVNPRAFLWTGDNMYFNIPDSVNHQRFFYYRRWSRPEFRLMTSRVPLYAIYDDHDFSGNDGYGGTDPLNPSWKKDIVLKLFKENYNNPYYGQEAELGDNGLGVYHDFEIGPAHFIMLDGRYHRSHPGFENSTMLGPVQKQWLKDKLLSSRGTFKVIVSPVPVAQGSKDGYRQITGYTGYTFSGWDTWDGFDAERQEIFDFIGENRIEGVFFLSGDRHRMDVWKIPRPQGHYDFIELSGAHLTKAATDPAVGHAEISVAVDKPVFGVIQFRFKKNKTPVVRYQIRDIDNNVIRKYKFSLKDLQFND